MSYVNNKLEKQSSLLYETIKKKPRAYGFEVTTRCPLNCVYCDRSSVNGGGEDVELDKLEQVFHKVGANTNILCGLGEATIHKQFNDIQMMLKGDAMLITSGSVRLDWKAMIAIGKIKYIAFSVDSPFKEDMERISKGYCWDNLLCNLSQARKQDKIFTMINATINANNYMQLFELVKFAYMKGIRSISINYPIMKDTSFIEEHSNEINQQLTQIMEFAKKNLGMIVDSPNRYKCFANSSIVAYVDIKGNVYPCCYAYNEGYLVGNLEDETFDAIWQKDRYDNFKNGELCKECMYNKILSLVRRV